MPLLLFKKRFRQDILAGRKTTTVRRWRKCNLRPGGKVTVLGLGTLIIEKAETVELASLTHADAVADGFQTLAELMDVIRKIYPNPNGDGKRWYRLKFRLSEAEPRHRLAAAVREQLDKAVQRNASSRTS